ncbi:hypothetical protein Aab01nite_78360 [Paractinoplanes abujensis]|uniref:RHIM domain-containing protein n=1 Tax=Paractinoplanes abujensis TaxID=882441 RepID=A0A7W7G149_9ACTN|nr:hypothetical protein [Actinoplanes abujensis]MBB4692274.1 hypothetical protein [Actinoplanes abujensis]GID24246.1 hypothetical protein Aab01nite_78360 [Actinoplanes abujensis]
MNVELIAAALAAGATAGVSDAAGAAVKDAYDQLKRLLKPRLRGDARAALESDETEPDVWTARIGEELTASGADMDPEVMAAVEHLRDRISEATKVNNNFTNAWGVQNGNHNVQTNYFGDQPQRGVAGKSTGS